MSDRNNERRGYHLSCPTCGVRPFAPCRSLTKGKITDTHVARLDLYSPVSRALRENALRDMVPEGGYNVEDF